MHGITRIAKGPGERPRPFAVRACATVALAGLAGATACTEYVPASIGGLAPDARVYYDLARQAAQEGPER